MSTWVGHIRQLGWANTRQIKEINRHHYQPDVILLTSSIYFTTVH